MATDQLLPIPEPGAKAPAKPAMTEGEVLSLLRAKHAARGNGGNGEYAFLDHVRDKAAFDAKRTLDAVAVSLWPSRGLTIDGFEVKVSRSDWLRELAQPEKAEDACAVVDRFWVVAPEGVVQVAELPPTWGYLSVHGGKTNPETGAVTGRKLRAVRAADLLHGDRNTRARPVSRDFLVGLLRAAGAAVPTAAADAARAEQAGRFVDAHLEYQRGRQEERAAAEKSLELLRSRLAGLEDAVQAFHHASGVRLSDTYGYPPTVSPGRAEDVGRALRAVLDGDDLVEAAERRVRTMAEQLRQAAGLLDDMRRPR